MNIVFPKINIFYIFISLCLILVAGLRFFGWANDTSNYYEMLIYKNETLLSTKELLFRFLIFINTELFSNDFTIFLLIFAFLGVSIKLYALIKLSPLPILSIILYLLSYFWLHEYVQIRAGVAAGIFLLATKDLSNENTKKYFFKVFLAILFHWSSIVLIPLYFIVRYKNLKLYAFLPLLGILLGLVNFNVYAIIQFTLVTFGIDPMFYKMYAGYQNQINTLNLISISYIFIFYTITFLIMKNKNSFSNYELTLYRIFSIGIFLFFITSLLNAPVVAFRLLEYFLVILLVLIPFIVIKFKQKLFVSILAILYYSFYCYFLFANVFSFGRGIL